MMLIQYILFLFFSFFFFHAKQGANCEMCWNDYCSDKIYFARNTWFNLWYMDKMPKKRKKKDNKTTLLFLSPTAFTIWFVLNDDNLTTMLKQLSNFFENTLLYDLMSVSTREALDYNSHSHSHCHSLRLMVWIFQRQFFLFFLFFETMDLMSLSGKKTTVHNTLYMQT